MGFAGREILTGKREWFLLPGLPVLTASFAEAGKNSTVSSVSVYRYANAR